LLKEVWMKPERWEQVDNLLQSALQRPPEQRAAFLKEACDGDEALRREVESLLRAHEQAGEFLEAPALEVEARALADNQSQPRVGGMIGPYRMLAPLGAGGMGEVYRARDNRLGREVAIKVLPAQFIQDEDRLRRFIREAQATSALNHPNIITIYEIGQSNGTHFIATELIEGQTLQQRSASTGMKLLAALDVAIQAASALSAAHAAGIVHRDIKPENLMLRPDGLVKVLDFGLAKLTEQRPRAADSEAPTALKVSTDPGTVLGTVQYMSPEQARGLEVDARTDIFSLGVVLYEMITGRAPFVGATKTDVLVAILEREPAPLSRHAPALPAELERIVTKALAKDREERYQTVKDLLIDLKRLKQRLEYEHYREREGTEAQAERSALAAPDGVALESGSKPELTETTQAAAVSTGETGTARTTSSAEIIISEIKRHKRGVGLALVIFVIAGAGTAYWLYQLLGQRQPSAALKITRLTFTGKATQAAISPDGKYVAYVQAEGGQRSLWLSQVAVANHNQIVPPAEVVYQSLTFSPDGNFIYYNQTGPNNQTGLYQMPFTGGGARKLREDVRSPISFSPDGKQFAFLRGGSGPGQREMVIASVDGSEEKVLATRKFPDSFSVSGSAWSPDGRIIACGANYRSSGRWSNVVGVRVADGAEQPITAQRWNGDIGQVAWLSDGSGLVVPATVEAGDASQVWLLSYPGNEARKITSDLNSYGFRLSLTADSRTLVAVQSESAFNLWIAPGGDGRGAKQITSGSGRADGHYGLDWTPGGKIVYQSLAGGSVNIWMIGTDGTGNKQLPTGAPPNTDPAVSPDGRYLIWAPRRADKRNIWRMNLDGSNQKQLTNGSNDALPQVSPDGKWVIYTGYNSELNIRLWKVPMDGGDPVQLTDRTAQNPAISPDGKLITCRYQERGAPSKLAIIPFEGGPPISLFDYPDPGIPAPPTLVRWTPDGRAVAYIRTISGVSNIWIQPIDGSPPKQLTDFKEQRLLNFAWSRDGKQLALSRGTANNDVVLISGFR
jgi:eukaryotic-like serine/threonine-protein kinase